MTVLFMLLSINLDSLVAGFSYGMRTVKIPLLSAAIISFFSVLYSALALTIGSSISNYIPTNISKCIGAFLMICIGVLVIINSIKESPEKSDYVHKEKKGFNLSIKSLGITISILRDPSLCDFDFSQVIDPREAIYLGFALSADAIGVALGCALSGISNIFLPFLIGGSQLILLYSGVAAGRFLNKHIRIRKVFCSIFSGIILVVLGILRMI